MVDQNEIDTLWRLAVRASAVAAKGRASRYPRAPCLRQLLLTRQTIGYGHEPIADSTLSGGAIRGLMSV